MYSDCPSELKVIRGTISSILVIITRHAAPPVLQIRLSSDSIFKFNSNRVDGNNSSLNASKNAYRFNGISVLTTTDVPKSAFLFFCPSTDCGFLKPWFS